jgi:hypothetical protein
MANQREIQEWLDKAEVIVQPNADQQRALEGIVGGDGLLVLLGLLVGSRQGFYLQLSQTPLSDPAQTYRAAVLQGQIKGIDLVAQTVLNMFPAAGDVSSTEQE